MTAPERSIIRSEIITVQDGQRLRKTDSIVVEEPLEIRIVSGTDTHSIAVTMRPPGHDFELAAGFLYCEGVVTIRSEIQQINYCTPPGHSQQYNMVNVHLNPDIVFDPQKFSRHIYTSSSCGICGKTSLEQVRAALPNRPAKSHRFIPEDRILLSLPERLREAQTIFGKTGGLHAAALFDKQGKLLLLNEDVGRHNALDKLISTLFLQDQLPVTEAILVVSGRASFELVQKSLMAGIPVLAAVGAPTSLAVELAREFGRMLMGFLNGGRFNLYTSF